MSARLGGKVAFITGAARGQGRAHAVRLASEGADILALDLAGPLPGVPYDSATPDDLAETARAVEALDRRVLTHEGDVRDFDGMKAFVDRGVAEFGRLDVVVANAGICTGARFWEISVEQWHEVIDTNLTGVFHTLRASVPILIEQGTGGSIIVTSSVAGLRGLPFLAHYSASKHAVVGLARSVANEVGSFGIRVNTVHPHGVDTPLGTGPDLMELIAEHAATLGPIFMATLPYRQSTPEDIAGTVAWLASDESRHVTGAAIPVDLGTLAR